MSDDIPDGLAQPHRQLAFLTIAATITMAVLDGALLIVALPVIAEALAVEAADAIWVISVYQLATVVALLPMAAVGEIVGLRRVYLSGVAVFVIASALCAVSGSLLELTIIRVLQGLSASAIMSLNGAQVRYIMPARLLGRGISAQALVVGVASAAGPMVASAILSLASWHWLFLINVPIGLIAFGVGLITLPKSTQSGRRLDLVSLLLNALTFGLLIYALGNASHFGMRHRLRTFSFAQ